jgi:hypothetical protein
VHAGAQSTESSTNSRKLCSLLRQHHIIYHQHQHHGRGTEHAPLHQSRNISQRARSTSSELTLTSSQQYIGAKQHQWFAPAALLSVGNSTRARLSTRQQSWHQCSTGSTIAERQCTSGVRITTSVSVEHQQPALQRRNLNGCVWVHHNRRVCLIERWNQRCNKFSLT